MKKRTEQKKYLIFFAITKHPHFAAPGTPGTGGGGGGEAGSVSNQQDIWPSRDKREALFSSCRDKRQFPRLKSFYEYDELNLSSLHSRAITRPSLDPLAPVGGGAGVVGVNSHFKSVGKHFTCRAILWTTKNHFLVVAIHNLVQGNWIFPPTFVSRISFLKRPMTTQVPF